MTVNRELERAYGMHHAPMSVALSRIYKSGEIVIKKTMGSRKPDKTKDSE